MKEHAKKALKHDFEVAGKTVPTLALVALFLVGTGSAALLNSFGTVSGTADVSQAVTVDGPDTVSYNTSMTAGATKIDTFNVTNDADVSAPVGFTTECEATNTEDISDSNLQDGDFDCDGVNHKAVAYYESAGSNFTGYSESVGDSGVVVDDDETGDYSSIQTAIDDSPAETIYVESGTYNTFTADRSVSVVGLNNPTTDSAATIVVDSENGRNTVSSEGVTVKGLHFRLDDQIGSSAIYVNSGATDQEIVIEDNFFEDTTSQPNPTTHGLKVSDSANTGVVNNRFEGFYHGVQVTNTAEQRVDIEENTFDSQHLDGVFVTAAKQNGEKVHDADVNVESNFFTDVGPDFPSGAVLLTQAEDDAVEADLEISKNVFTESNSVDVRTADPTDGYLEVESVSGTLNADNNFFGEDGIQTVGDVTASYGEVSSETLSAGETDTVGIYTNFDVALAPGDYEVDFNVQPSSATS